MSNLEAQRILEDGTVFTVPGFGQCEWLSKNIQFTLHVEPHKDDQQQWHQEQNSLMMQQKHLLQQC